MNAQLQHREFGAHLSPATDAGAPADAITVTFDFMAGGARDEYDHYHRLLVRLGRYKHLRDLHASDIVVRNEKRLLRAALDQLLDDGDTAIQRVFG